MLHIFSVTSSISSKQHFSLGIPLAKGYAKKNTNTDAKEQAQFLVQNELGETIEACVTPTAYWPDKTIKWLSIEGFLDQHSRTGKYFLVPDADLKVEKHHASNYQLGNFSISDVSKPIHSESRLSVLNLKAKKPSPSISLYLTHHEKWQRHINESVVSTYILNDQLIRNTLRHSSSFFDSDDSSDRQLNCFVTVKHWPQSGVIDIQFKVHNPKAQSNQGGKWDLGDENSLYLSDLGICIDLPESTTNTLSISKDAESVTLDNSNEQISLHQYSSGGDNWNCANHVNSDNVVSLKQKGALLVKEIKEVKECKEAKGNEILQQIDRPEPVVRIQTDEVQYSLHPQHFWQKFPCSLRLSGTKAEIDFTGEGSQVEIQPGETKSHRLFISLDDVEIANTPAPIEISLSQIESSQAIPWFNADLDKDPHQIILKNCLNGEHNFFAKRESLDEYGWRNYGDIYADHEAHNFSGKLPFISHYNNQYDPLFGFYKQYFLTGDIKYQQLAQDLLDHTLNIDIYRSELDKPEYNHGLFWHTDHYVQAATATHRTYSKHQADNVYSNHAGGGGPGAHHCYPTGLALGYYSCADEDLKSAVLKMAQWMTYIYEGDGTLLGKLLQVKNCNYLRVPFSDKLLLGAGTGITRNPFTNQYPLDRGTGNYVNILLDAYEMSGDSAYLSNAERVILCTIDENDELNDGRFYDIENTWFYTVFLQAVSKYLFLLGTGHIKREASTFILNAFIHYLDYICEHERLYLDHAERLEYPNDTWTAQDIRKVQLLCIGTWFVSAEKADSYIAKAKQLNAEIYNKLKESPENVYTRLLVLMMQNYGGPSLVGKRASTFKIPSCSSKTSKQNIKISFLKRVWTFLRAYSVSRERKHLSLRVPKLQKWIGKP
uniref:hypothetical protein n=1 Tax=Ningiella ruwaisensis TaxID=2364274 RepID=UPI0010A02A58|nr:hypothetical protein [Ningiella ruwaisensis]